MEPCGTRRLTYAEDMSVVRTKLQWILLGMGIAIAGVLPHFLGLHWLSVINLILIYVVAVEGLNILTGYCGQISVGQAAFMAVGAYTAATLATHLHLPWLATLPCAALSAAIVGLFFGIPSLRMKGFYLAISTLAAQFIIMFIVSHLKITGLNVGLVVGETRMGSLFISGETTFYYVNVIVAAIMIFLAKCLTRTDVGRSFIAIRDNDLAAEVMGINIFRYKLLAFSICSAFAGVAGWMLCYYMGAVAPEHFTLDRSIWFLGMVIVGGMGSITGAIFGVIFIQLLEELAVFLSPILVSTFPMVGESFFNAITLAFFAIVIILFLVFEPRGLYHRWQIFKSYYRLFPFSY